MFGSSILNHVDVIVQRASSNVRGLTPVVRNVSARTNEIVDWLGTNSPERRDIRHSREPFVESLELSTLRRIERASFVGCLSNIQGSPSISGEFHWLQFVHGLLCNCA